MAHHKFYWDQEAEDRYGSGYACLCGVTYGESEIEDHMDEDDCEFYEEQVSS